MTTIVRLSCTAALCAAAAAFWSASVFITGWHGQIAERVAVFPSARVAWTAIVAALVLFTAVAWTLRNAARMARPFESLWPVMALGLLGLPFLPRLGDALPLLNVLAGPLRWAVLGLVTAACAWPLGERVFIFLTRHATAARLAAAAFVFYSAVGLWVTSVQGVGGDEPHYLVVAESLRLDRDLDIENNHDRGDYLAFTSQPLIPHSLRRGLNDVLYSVHAPGLPVLVLPAYVAAGRPGVTVFLSLVAAIASAGVFRLATGLAGPAIGLATWLATAFTVPWLFHGWMIFPEMPAAAIVAWALWWVWADRNIGWGGWLARGVAIAALPWLHSKFAVLMAGLAVCLALRIYRRPVLLASFALPLAASTAAWFAFFYWLYGTADPTIPYGGSSALARDFAWNNVPRGVLGLLFDQEYGLFWVAPAYLLAAFGVRPLIRRSDTRLLVLGVALTGMAFTVSSARYYMWWGGASVPARFLIPCLPMLAVLLAMGCKRLVSSPIGRAFATLLFSISLATAATMLVLPERYLAFNDRDGTSRWIEWIQGPFPATLVLPSFLDADWRVQLPRFLLLFGGALGTTMVVAARRWVADSPQRAAAALLIVVGTMGLGGAGIGARWLTTPEVRAVAERDGELRLLAALPRYAFDLGSLRWRSQGALLQRWRLPLFERVASRTLDPPEDSAHWLGPFDLPPGRYLARFTLTAPLPAGESIYAGLHRTPARLGDLRGGAVPADAAFEFDVPAALTGRPVWFGGSSSEAIGLVSHAELRAIGVERAALPGEVALAVENVQGSATALLAYMDGHAFPENGVFWTEGGEETRVLILPAGAAHVTVRIETGAAGGAVRLQLGGVPTEVELAPRRAHVVEAGIAPGEQAVSLRVGFSSGFRPRDVDSASQDGRWLGVRVYVTVS